MTKAKSRVLSPEEEDRIRAGIALDPDNPELTDEEIASLRPARDVLPPDLFAALTRLKPVHTEAPKRAGRGN